MDDGVAGRSLSAGRVLLGLGLAAAALGTVALLSDVLLVAFAGVLLGVGLRGAARWLHGRTGLPVGAGVALVSLGVLAGTVAFCWFIGPSLATQADQLGDQLSRWWQQGESWLRQSRWTKPLGDQLEGSVGTGLSALGRRLLTVASTTFGLVGSAVVILFTGLYLAADPATYRRGLLRLVPLDRRARAGEVLDALDQTMNLWLLGRLIDMIAVIALTYAGLMLLGIPLALALAVFAGVLNFVPYIGAFAGAVPAILVALGGGPWDALWVGLLFAGIQGIEGYLLAPFIQQRTVDLPAALTILSQTLFGALFGFLGLLLAPALATVATVLVRMLYVEDVLGDREGG